VAVVALVVHPERRECKEAAGDLAAWLRARGHTVVLPRIERHGDGGYAGDLVVEGLDLAVSLGGDGTMLRTVELAAARGAPVLGVNLGNLGYLSAVEASETERALERFLAGEHAIEERMMLEVRLDRRGSPAGEPARSWLALNEAVLEKTVPGHTIRLSTSIAGRPFVTYAVDGLLVATPTGSTAYNLSVRGPIVSPQLWALVVSPVSPHMLFDRALVLEPSQSVGVEVLPHRPCVLVVDGAEVATLSPGDAVLFRSGEHPARFVSFGGDRDFHAILKAKFGLADR
jgi:NAD+ kinase